MRRPQLSRLATAAAIGALGAFVGPASATPPTLGMVDTVCKQLSSNLTKKGSVPRETSAERLGSKCSINGKKLSCVYRGVDPTTRFGGNKTSKSTYDIVVMQDDGFIAVKHGTLGSEQLVVDIPTGRYVSTGTYFQGYPTVMQKHCVGTLR